MKHIEQEELVLYHYGDRCDRAGIEQHLGECAECRAELASIANVLAAVPVIEAPERPADYELRTWQRVAAQLPEKRRPWWEGIFASRLAVAGAMVVLLIAAFLLGRAGRPEPGPEEVASKQPVRERVLLVAVGNHLERSQMLLVELTNARTDASLDISAEQKQAEDLVDANRLYRQTALQAGDKQMADVLDQLERALLDIAHSPSQLTPGDLQEVRQRLEKQGILFKIRVIGSDVRARQTPVPAVGNQKL